jgi:hypothetical protein
MILDPEVSFGEVRFPRRSTVKQQVLYQGTTSVVPKWDGPYGLQPLSVKQGLKPLESALSAARLKPCPDTRRLTSESGMIGTR